MIKLLRVDDAFLHGRIALIWSKKIKLDKIVIANNNLVNDNFMKMVLQLAKPKNIDLIFANMMEIKKIIDDNYNLNLMVVVNNLYDAKIICEELEEVKSVNIGGLKEKPSIKEKMITGGIFLSENDIEICKELKQMGIEVEIRKVPDETKIIIC